MTTWNYALEEMTGIKKHNIIGKGNYEHSHAFYKKRDPVLADYIISRDPAILSQYDNQHIDGDIIRVDKQGQNPITGRNVYLSIRAAPLYDINGIVIGSIETIRDISWRKEMEYEISRQTMIFEAVSCAASYILQSDSLDDCIFQTIQYIGKAAHAGIVSLFEINNQPGSDLSGKLRFEWINSERISKSTAYLHSKIWKEREISVLMNVFSERIPYTA